MRVVTCRFPFPPQDPPIEMPEPCSSKCPLYDARTFALHGKLAEDDPELLKTLKSFADWMYQPGQDLDEQIRYAAQLYTRDDHDGTCIPKTILFAHYKSLQYNSYGPGLQVRAEALAAFKGEPSACWPDGEIASGVTWNELFGGYSKGYD